MIYTILLVTSIYIPLLQIGSFNFSRTNSQGSQSSIEALSPPILHGGMLYESICLCACLPPCMSTWQSTFLLHVYPFVCMYAFLLSFYMSACLSVFLLYFCMLICPPIYHFDSTLLSTDVDEQVDAVYQVLKQGAMLRASERTEEGNKCTFQAFYCYVILVVRILY